MSVGGAMVKMESALKKSVTRMDTKFFLFLPNAYTNHTIYLKKKKTHTQKYDAPIQVHLSIESSNNNT